MTNGLTKWVVQFAPRKFLGINFGRVTTTSLAEATKFEDRDRAEAIAFKHKGQVVELSKTIKVKLNREIYEKVQEAFGISNAQITPALIESLVLEGLEQMKKNDQCPTPKLAKLKNVFKPSKPEYQEVPTEKPALFIVEEPTPLPLVTKNENLFDFPSDWEIQ